MRCLWLGRIAAQEAAAAGHDSSSTGGSGGVLQSDLLKGARVSSLCIVRYCRFCWLVSKVHC
jgi:hypothetical protein